MNNFLNLPNFMNFEGFLRKIFILFPNFSMV